MAGKGGKKEQQDETKNRIKKNEKSRKRERKRLYLTNKISIWEM
jgi:hypothetical protein